MAYFYHHMSWEPKIEKWFVHLEIPSKLELNDSMEYVTGVFGPRQSICLQLDGAKNQHPNNGVGYRMVTMRHQIDNNNKMFLSLSWNIRQQIDRKQSNNAALAVQAVRYATQYDFDKYCFENPTKEFDWNAEVYKTFISPVQVRMVTTTTTGEN